MRTDAPPFSAHRVAPERAPRPFGRLFLAAVASASLVAFSAWSPARAAEPPSLERVRLMLLWTPQSQFAGFYVAQEKGLYAERGLDVEILPGGPDRDPVACLEAEKADVAVLWLASALAAADRGVGLSHVVQIFASSHLAIVGWKDKGIATVRDLDARRVSVWGGPLFPSFSAFFASQKIAPTIVPQYRTVNLFLARGVDACSVMDYNESHLIYQSGVDDAELARFPLADHGIDFPEDGLYCLRRTRASRSAVCAAFAAATMAGWRRAAENPEEAVDIVMKHVREASLPTNRTHMRWMLRTVLPSVFPKGETAPGVLARKAYEETGRWLIELGAVTSVPPYDEFTR